MSEVSSPTEMRCVIPSRCAVRQWDYFQAVTNDYNIPGELHRRDLS